MEEVIKIQSSYRIIKSDNIHCEGESQLTINNSYEKKIDFYIPNEKEEKHDDLIDLDSIKEEIRISLMEDLKEELYKETEEERKKIIDRAKNKAKELLEQAEEQGFESGLKEGFTKGYNQGIEEAKEEASKIRENAIQTVQEAHKYVEEFYTKSHDEIIRLAADMAEAIIHTTINESSENILMLVKPIIQRFGKTGSIIITCHPDSLDYLKMYQYKLEEICPNTIFTILGDGNLEQDGFVIENENQIFDLQVSKQIESILRSIEDIENQE